MTVDAAKSKDLWEDLRKITDMFGSSVKKPQMYGIIAGIIVFTITISVVIYLLFLSGAVTGALKQMQRDENSGGKSKHAKKDKTTAGQGVEEEEGEEEEEVVGLLDERPELYDELIQAAHSIPLKLNPAPLKLNTLTVHTYVMRMIFRGYYSILLLFKSYSVITVALLNTTILHHTNNHTSIKI